MAAFFNEVKRFHYFVDPGLSLYPAVKIADKKAIITNTIKNVPILCNPPYVRLNFAIICTNFIIAQLQQFKKREFSFRRNNFRWTPNDLKIRKVIYALFSITGKFSLGMHVQLATRIEYINRL